MAENIKAVTLDHVHAYSKHFNDQRANRVAANASVLAAFLKRQQAIKVKELYQEHSQ